MFAQKSKQFLKKLFISVFLRKKYYLFTTNTGLYIKQKITFN